MFVLPLIGTIGFLIYIYIYCQFVQFTYSKWTWCFLSKDCSNNEAKTRNERIQCNKISFGIIKEYCGKFSKNDWICAWGTEWLYFAFRTEISITTKDRNEHSTQAIQTATFPVSFAPTRILKTTRKTCFENIHWI